MKNSYLGLGSNLKSPVRQLTMAIQRIKAMPQTSIVNIASFYDNPAVGVRRQPRYANTVVHIQTRLTPFNLLTHCQSIERQLGRVRKKKWDARTLDIDILLMDGVQLNHPRLTVPHPLYKERPFVQIPLKEVLHPRSHAF